MNENKHEQLQREWSIVGYFHGEYFYVTIVLFCDWKQSVKLLLGKHELALQNL